MKNISPLKKSLLLSACMTLIVTVSGCQLAENTLKADRATGQEIQNYRDMLAPREAPLETKNSDIPELQSYVADTSQSMKAMPLVSISINQSIPLRDALFELSKQADYDIQLDPRIVGSIIYTARNKPFDIVVSQISEIAGLRYKFEDDTLKVELDTPYTRNYKVEYLAFTRESKSSIDTSTKVESGEGGGGPTTGSSFGVSSESKTDFWGELDTNVKQILAANSQLNYLITGSDPEVSVSTTAPPVPPLDEGVLDDAPATNLQSPGEQQGSIVSNYSAGQMAPQVPLNSSSPGSPGDVPTGSAIAPTTSPPDDQSATQNAQTGVVNTPVPANTAPVNAQAAPAQQVQLNVSSLPTTSSSSSGDGASTYQPSYSLNKQAGLVSVYATQRAHDQIANYLDLMRKAVTSQVLIEAKVLEVELNDEFAYGIDWDLLNDSETLGIGFTALRGPLVPPEASAFTLSQGNNPLETLVSAIQRFGTVHALASPRLTVLNNQSAVLNVAQNQVYFELETELQQQQSDSDLPPLLSVNSTIKNVPEGVLINVLPSIDTDRNMVSMQVRPTISRITGFVSDPAVGLTLAGLENPPDGISSDVPVVSTKEVDTVVNMKSGQTLVMGGLLEDRTESTQRAVPIAGEIPVIGALFRAQNDAIHKSEMVILLKASIITPNDDTVHNTDRDMYRVYAQDRRPFKL